MVDQRRTVTHGVLRTMQSFLNPPTLTLSTLRASVFTDQCHIVTRELIHIQLIGLS